MSALDELREKVSRMIAAETNLYTVGALVAVQMCIEDTEAAHPGLEDHTVPCPRCSNPTVLNGRYKDRLLGYWREVCPACSEKWQGR